MTGGLVSESKFNELVASTTSYLQNLLDRVIALEAKLAEAEKEPAGSENDAE